MVLTKEEILRGSKDTKVYKIEALGGEEVELRLLSQNEINEIQRIESEGLGVLESQESGRRIGRRTTNGQYNNITKINASKQIAQSAKAKLRAVALSLSHDDETWSEKEVESLSAPVFDEIYDCVSELNKLGEDVEGDIDEFLEN